MVAATAVKSPWTSFSEHRSDGLILRNQSEAHGSLLRIHHHGVLASLLAHQQFRCNTSINRQWILQSCVNVNTGCFLDGGVQASWRRHVQHECRYRCPCSELAISGSSVLQSHERVRSTGMVSVSRVLLGIYLSKHFLKSTVSAGEGLCGCRRGTKVETFMPVGGRTSWGTRRPASLINWKLLKVLDFVNAVGLGFRRCYGASWETGRPILRNSCRSMILWAL